MQRGNNYWVPLVLISNTKKKIAEIDPPHKLANFL